MQHAAQTHNYVDHGLPATRAAKICALEWRASELAARRRCVDSPVDSDRYTAMYTVASMQSTRAVATLTSMARGITCARAFLVIAKVGL